jgi:hypothetical protein
MREQKGVILIVTLIIMSILFSVALAFSVLILSDIKKAGEIDKSVIAYYAADAGLEQSLFLMRKESNADNIDSIADLLGLRSGATLDNNSKWDLNSSTDSESVVYRQRLDNGESIKLYFLNRSGLGSTNNAKSMTVDWEKGSGSPKLQVSFTQIDPQFQDVGIGNDILINYTDINDIISLDGPTDGGPTECYDFGDEKVDSSPFVSDYVVEVKTIGSADEYVDNLTIKSYGVKCSSIVEGTEVDGEAITNLTIRSGGTYNGAYQEIVAHLPPKDLVSGVADFVLFSDESIAKDFSSRGYRISDCFDAGVDPIHICTCDDLDNVRNYPNNNFELQNDIDFAECDAQYTTGAGWEPIGSNSSKFTGVFDGQNNIIQNLYIDRGSDIIVGLFEFVNDGAEIKNTRLTGVNITGRKNVGGLVGAQLGVSIDNCSVEGTIIGTQEVVGGLVGLSISTTINNSWFSGDVTGTGSTGGLVGSGDGVVIMNSHSGGNVTGFSNVGGLTGYAYGDSRIESSYSTSSIDGTNFVGGLVGQNNVGLIFNSYATGEVNGTDNVGGLVGINKGSSVISDSYSIGIVSGGSNMGGLIGENESSLVTNSYWNTDIFAALGCGQGACTGATGKTTAEMVQEDTYQPEWGFVGDRGHPVNKIWRINEGLEYPCLNWQTPGTCPAP